MAVITNGPRIFLKSCKNRLTEEYQRWWLNAVNDSESNPILRTYKLFKTSHAFEPYLFLQLPRKYQKYICRFRVSSHELRIHTGRYQGIRNRNERLCLFCNSEQVDDEYHFIMKCSFHAIERIVLLNVVQMQEPKWKDFSEKERFIHLLHNKNPDSLRSLGKYLESGFKRRENHTNNMPDC